jgi:hypothetical protein
MRALGIPLLSASPDEPPCRCAQPPVYAEVWDEEIVVLRSNKEIKRPQGKD